MHLLSMKHFKNAVSVPSCFPEGRQGTHSGSKILKPGTTHCMGGGMGVMQVWVPLGLPQRSTSRMQLTSAPTTVHPPLQYPVSSMGVQTSAAPHSVVWRPTLPQILETSFSLRPHGEIWRLTASFTSAPHCRSSRLHPLWTVPVGY